MTIGFKDTWSLILVKRGDEQQVKINIDDFPED
jgi:hypothetical protein